ncbi:beta strand repeat-containing protein [Cognatilysobacter terrigena]|uniref:beta strand repeat-containing protein n=1 Tax=Cognatilysobacter terrigena TaxID=2488749 RepID=UPI00105E0062|nr:Ig-like domain-containing protein [Lysobacter terrigena]
MTERHDPSRSTAAPVSRDLRTRMRRALHRARHWATSLVLVAVTLAALPDAHAQRAFARRFPDAAAPSLNIEGDIVLIGNVNLTCPAGSTSTDDAATCANVQAGANGRNNGFAMTAVNIDADGTNTNSSIATLNLPAGSNVLFAGLYWGAVQATASARTTVRLKAPGAGYVGVTAGVTDAIGSTYQSFADVTSIVQSAGNGAYTVGNIGQSAAAGNWSGWTLVVAYQKNGAQLRNLSVFDGLQAGNGTNTQFDIGISGFYTPPTGTVNSNIGFVLYDGDRGQNDDAGGAASLLFGKDIASLSAVFDAINPQADFWNSSISFQGANVTAGRTPSYVNLLGVDIDNVKPNVPLPNGSTTAVARFRASANDVNYPGVITLATDVFEPEIVTSFTKTATNDNGTTSFHPGDIVTYTISLTNRGNDNSNNTRITDPLPAGVTYVPGSLQVTSGANSGVMTDAAGDDQADYSPGTRTVTFRVGTTADASTGGVIAPTVGTTVTFKVSIDPVANNTSLSNVANVNYVSNTSGIAGSGKTQPSSFTVTGNADLSVTKTGPATVGAGAPISYTVTVANAGPDAANGAVLADTLPPGITGVSINCTPSGGASCPATMTNSMAIPTLPSGGSVVFTYNGTAPSSATTLTNTATITAPPGVTDPSTANNSASATTSVQTADIAVTNVASAGPYYPNQTVTYTLTVTNNGAGTADAVSLSDTLPASMTFVSLTAPAGWSATTPAVGASGTVTATTASLAPGATATFTLVVQIPAGAANGSTFSDTATVSASSVDPAPANNSATASITITAGADVSINKTLVTTGTYYEGQPLAYTLVVSNAGPVTATNVQVTDTPTNLTITNVSGAGCSALPCTIASLAAGASATINVTATPVAGTFDNAASVSAAQPDPTPGNNSDTTGNGGTAMAAMDLAVTNVLTSTSPAATGSQVTYTITVTNNGPQSVPGASLTETMPPQLTGVTWTCASGCDVASGSGDINVGITFPVGGSITILVAGTAPSTTPSTIAAATATANPSSFAIDANTANNAATAPAVPVSALLINAIDDAGSTGGASGGTAIATVLANDTLNTAAATTANVALSVVTPASSAGVTLNLANGAITVAAGTPSATYTIAYRICETANPGNCDDATATVTVTSATLVANNDAGTANGQTGGTTVADVLGNDTLNGSGATTSNATLSQVSTSNPKVTLDISTGAVNVAPGTPAGTYTLVYRMCEAINPANCQNGTVTVTVTAAVIDAVDDTAGPVEGSAGATAVVNVLANDTIGSTPATASNAVLTPTTSGALTLNANGTVDVAANTPAGAYPLTYQLCEQLNPTNCDTATVTVNVSAAVIAANDDAPPAIVGASGGVAIATVLANDWLGAAAPSTSNVTLTQQSTSNAAVTLNASSGAVNVAAGTPAGTYTLVYRICQTLNPTNCDTATVTVVVSAAAVDAVNDAAANVNGVAGNANVVNVLGNDTLNGAAATLSNATLAQVSTTNANVTLNASTGAIAVAAGTPAGTYALTYRLCEQLNPGNCDTATATVDVVAPALAAANDTGTTTQNTAIALTVLANDTMAGSAATSTAVSVAIATAPQHGTATVGTNGVVTYTPTTNYSGTDTFTYHICDVVNPTVCATATANLVVTPTAVDAIDQTVSTPQTGPIAIDPMRTTTNGGGAPLDPSSVQIVTPPSTGTVVVNPNGTITLTPDRLFFGTVSFRYRICDRSTPTPVCDVATVTANVAMQAPQLRLVKTVPTRSVHVGDLVRYTVVVENTGISPANNATVVDTPPAGFTYVEGSLSVDDADDRFVLAGTQPIRINGIDVPVGGRATVVYVLRVGAGVGRGTHTNSVSATDATGSTVSNTATADVTIEGDPTVDDALILGTVFADVNGDGMQQDGEAGLPGVRIASVEGLVIETDVHGRFHLAGVQPQSALRGSNFVLKVDAATLPPGSTFTTANPLVRRITPGLSVRFDFGVSLPAGTDAGTTR